jgi:DNA-binding MarR family transcriptional regulator
MMKEAESPIGELFDGDVDAVMREFVGYNLKRAYIVLHQAATRALEEHDLRVRSFSALSLIVGNPGVSPSELADMLQMERSNLVLIVDELDTRDLISRTRMKSDRRRYALNATLRGRRLHEKAAAAIRRADERPLLRLTAEDRAQLVNLLSKIEMG